MYKSMVIKIFLIDIGIVLALESLFVVTFLLYRQVPSLKRYTYATFFLALMGLVGLWIYRFDFVDVVNYFQQGDAYLQKTTCLVDAVTGSTGGRLLLGQKHIACEGQGEFHVWLSRDPLFPREGERLVLTYLPLSRRVVEMRDMNGEILWPGDGGWQGVLALVSVVVIWIFWCLITPSHLFGRKS